MVKCELIQELIKLTKLQSSMLEEENIDEFISLLDKRQEVIDQLGTLSGKEMANGDEQEKKLVEELKKLDNKNRIEFMKQFDEVKWKLKQIRQLKQGDKHYSNPYSMANEEGVYFDIREKKTK